MWKKHINATSVEQVVHSLAEGDGRARIIAGGTDLILELERGIRTNIDTLIDVTRIPGLDTISLSEDGRLHIGPLVTHNQLISNPLARKVASPLVEACYQVGSPQIRNRGTLAGNVITASPANDTITPLIALGASVGLMSKKKGTRYLDLEKFYSGVRRNLMEPEEFLVEITIKAMETNQVGTFYKYGLRKTQAISVVNSCVILTMDQKIVKKAVVTLGAVAPTIFRSISTEEYLVGKELSAAVVTQAGRLAAESSRPIDDIRSSAQFRRHLVALSIRKSLEALRSGDRNVSVPAEPVLLDTSKELSPIQKELEETIDVNINGKSYHFPNARNKTLLQLIREDAGLTGTKEGCAEGECGACTVYLDGKAVMSCLVPAGRAHGATVITIEGLAEEGKLNPVQQGFIEKGAVQCGYCTPGMIMASTKLLEEKGKPSEDEVRQALAGNLCRCTGYYQILEALETAMER